MNTNQRNVLLAGTVTLLLMIAFPPWQYFNRNNSEHNPMGFHFLLSKPTVDSLAINGNNPAHIGVEVDAIRLAVQIITVAFLTVASFLLLMDKTETVARLLGFTLLGIGLVALICYFFIWIIVGKA